MSRLDEIMLLVDDIEDKTIGHERGDCEEPVAECATLRDLIAAALAARDAEIERLNHAYHQQREGAQARVDAAVLRALTAERELTELKRAEGEQ